MYRPGSPTFGRFLTPRDLRRYGPTSATVDRVRASLHRAGLTASWADGANTWLMAGGPVQAVDATFRVDGHQYALPDGNRFYASARDPTVPVELRPAVSAAGRISSYRERVHRALRSVPSGGLTPDGLLTAYGLKPLRDMGLDGTGETVAFVEIDGFKREDFDSFTEKFGLASMQPEVNVLPASSSYTSPAFGFTLDYPDDAPPSQTSDSGVAWSGTYNEGPATWQFVGANANDRAPQQVVNDVQQNNFPSAQVVYEIPGADLGYTPGYGAVYDLFVNPATGQSDHQHLVVIAAIKNGVAVVFAGAGPFVQTSRSQDGHPNPAETPMVHESLLRQAIESVTWKGDPPL
jgi:hypothetical protein